MTPSAPCGAAADRDGNGDERRLARAGLRGRCRAIREQGFPAHVWHHDRPARLHHAIGDAFAHPVARALLRLPGHARGRDNAQLVVGLVA